jgi:hypothetical protein
MIADDERTDEQQQTQQKNEQDRRDREWSEEQFTKFVEWGLGPAVG